jgi:hypothetical protein
VFLAGLGLLLLVRRNPAAFFHYCLGRPLPTARSLKVFLLLLLAVVGGRVAIDLLRQSSVTPLTLENVVNECCVPPLNEEVVFRGVFLAVLLAQPQLSRTGAVLLSAMIFAAAHFPSHVLGQLPPLLTLGVLLGMVYYWTRCVLLCMACHAVWNAFCFWPANHWW